MRRNSKGLAQIIIVIVLLILVGAATYYFGIQKGKGTLSPIQEPSAVSIPSNEPSQTPFSNMQSFTTKDGKFILEYPVGWTLVDNSKNIDLYNDGKFQFAQDVTISKDGYKFISRNPLAWGPSGCVFPDSSSYKEPIDGPMTKYDTYTEFQCGGTVCRRVKLVIPSEVNNNYVSWGVCSKEKSSGMFGSVAGFGTVSYQSPINYDEKTIQTMDQILASFRAN